METLDDDSMTCVDPPLAKASPIVRTCRDVRAKDLAAYGAASLSPDDR
jgi:hypothetical protein